MKKYRILLTIISLCLTVTIITGVSYALYTFQNNQTDNNVANSDCFKLSFEDNNDITLQNAVPINESTAIQLTPYHFTIKNICNHTSKYLITLERLNTSTLNDEFIMIKLNDYTSTLLSEFPDFNEYILNDNVINSKGLYSEYLLPNEEKAFNLWMWVDENSTIEAAEKEYNSKIVVTGYLIKDPYINISFNAGNGTVNPAMKQGLVGRNIGELPIPTKDDDVFVGWYTSEGKLVDENTTFDEDTELYARWRSEPIDLKFYLRSLTQDNASVVQDDLSGDANMRYIGTDPNNYILFACDDEENPTIDTCEMWRIIGTFNSNSHNNSNELVKIVKADPISNAVWDKRQTSGNNYWEGSTLSNKLNSESYKYISSNLAQSVTWKLGAVASSNVYAEGGVLNLYNGERSNQKSPAYYYTATYNGIVTIPYASDYFFATSGDGTLAMRKYCVESALTRSTGNLYWSTNGTCSNTSWLITTAKNNNSDIWTVTSNKDSQFKSYIIFNNNSNTCISDSTNVHSFMAQPSLYLKPDLTCINCNGETAGTRTNPFIIKQQ